RPRLGARGRAWDHPAERGAGRRDPRGGGGAGGARHLPVTLVRDAMVPEPRALAATATAQEAGALLERPEVRSVLVSDDGQLVGVITRKTLVREVVAAGRDPRTTPVGAIAEPPLYTLDPELPL